MKKLLFTTTFLITGCTSSSTCDLAKKVSGAVATEIATVMECKNTEAIKTDVQKILEDAKICKPMATGPLGEVVCPLLVSGLMSGALKVVPAKWECSGGAAKDGLGAVILELCKRSI